MYHWYIVPSTISGKSDINDIKLLFYLAHNEYSTNMLGALALVVLPNCYTFVVPIAAVNILQKKNNGETISSKI